MKLQTLTVLFIIIILPITMVVSQYIKTEISTITLQSEYDTKLNNATYDAIKAFQMNESNSTTENIPTEKIRDVNASVNSFYNSMSASMGVSGYTEEDLKGYIPCLVYTLYDGYYIYTSYTNNKNEKEYGLKPYVYYTENISNGNNIDVTVSYTLDNYIMIVGYVPNSRGGKEYITKSGYLYYDNGYAFTEKLKDNIDYLSEVKYQVPYKYLKGENNQSIKYYFLNNEWYDYSTTGKLQKVTNQQIINELGTNTEDESAKKYVEEAKEFTTWVNNYLGNLRGYSYLKIDANNNPDSYSSAFNEHRRQVIKDSITTNLQATLTNYKGNIDEFQMPELDETEWDKIMNNVSLISFMQGLPLKNKYYRGYSVVTNTQSREFVNPNEIYIIHRYEEANYKYHRITCKENVFDNSLAETLVGLEGIKAYRNTSFGVRKFNRVDTGNGGVVKDNYYYMHNQKSTTLTACYECIVTSSNTYSSFDEAIENVSIYVKRAYYTALYRERYVNYKSLNFGTE